MYASGNAAFDPAFHAADRKVCNWVCREFGLCDSDIGLVLRAIVTGANMYNNKGVCDWNPLEAMAICERSHDGRVGTISSRNLDEVDGVMEMVNYRGGSAMLNFPDGLDILSIPNHGAEHGFPESPWGILPRIILKISNLSSDPRDQHLKYTVNSLVGWQQDITEQLANSG